MLKRHIQMSSPRKRGPIVPCTVASGIWVPACAGTTAAVVWAIRSSRSPQLYSLSFEHLERGGRAGAQEAHVAAHREEAHAALSERDRPLGGMAISAHHLAGLARRRGDAVELAVDIA